MKWPWIRRRRCQKEADRLRQRLDELKSQRDHAREQRDRYRLRVSKGEGSKPTDAGEIDAVSSALAETTARLEKALVEREEFRVLHREVIKDLELAEANPLPLDLDYPLPSSDLLWRIGGMRAASSYLQVGETVKRDLANFCQMVDRDITKFQSVLDFGCGCGRVLRRLPDIFPNARIYGSDVDGEAVQWCEDNLPFLAGTYVLPEMPPSNLKSDSLDFIFAISVFTHLPLAVERAWLEELRRIAKPGALIVLSFMPDTAAAEHFTPDMAVKSEDGFSFYKTMPIPELPEYYHGSYHSDEAMRSVVGEQFDVLSIQTRAVNDHQSVIIAECPS